MDLAQLHAADVASYLLDLDLLTESEVVADGIAIYDSSRRNTNFRVQVEGGRGFVVKQPRFPHEGVKQEAKAYAQLRASARTRDLIPGLSAWDAERQILVTELVVDGRDISTYHHATGRFSRALGARIGQALAVLHETPARACHCKTPWILSVHDPHLDALGGLSAANLEMIRLIQEEPLFGSSLRTLASELESGAFAHNDLRADNLIVARGGIPLFVDLETAGPGDPAWDIGGLFGSYLAIWLSSIPVSEAPPERWPALARRPLASIQPLLGSLWADYRECRRLNDRDSRRMLDHAVRAAGAWLTQFAFERSTVRIELDSSSKLMLQLGRNALARPLEAQVHLLGIPLSS